MLGLLERANLRSLPPFHLRMKIHPVSKPLCCLEYQIMDEVQKLSNPECHTSSPEPFKIEMLYMVQILRASYTKPTCYRKW
jgi:hypothetical protein